MEPFESALLPVLPLKDSLVFPGAVTPLFVNRPRGLAAIETSLISDKRIFLCGQRDFEAEQPSPPDLYRVGCVAEVLQVLRVPDGSQKILVEGIYAARAVDFMDEGDQLQALLVRLDIKLLDDATGQAYRRTTLSLFERYTQLSEKIPEDLQRSINDLEDPLAVLYAVANYVDFRLAEKQRVLEVSALEEKFMLLNANLEKEIQVMELEDQIVSQVRSQIGETQREYFLNEQMKAIERELGTGDDNREIEELREQIAESGMPVDARAKAEKELERLARMAPYSPEATVARTFIGWLTEVPWKARSADRIDLRAAAAILDEDHYGLEKAKQRIVEYLAVVKLARKTRGPILCFVGPPGVGKTSLARSIARCIDRRFVRISLGGVHDEAEIRGHRRTYIGAMPGKIVQSMKKAGTVNPVLLLDEIDKMSSDFRGDPSSALLEVLDPEQNDAFVDHYLEVDYNLSEVMFITTANTTAGIPPPLLDRMEIIRLSGYTDLEKLEIARRFLVPKALQAAGLKQRQATFQKAVLQLLIRGYTRESGVRNLEREINSVCRKIARRVVDAEEENRQPGRVSLTPATLREFLGPEPYPDRPLARRPEIGNAIGLAWTEAGGELLHVESRTMAGTGKLLLTGTLGDVMKESANTALSFIRSHARELNIPPGFHNTLDIHIHLPEGAIPKDGPSAGIALASSLASILAEKPVRQDAAMTGEMTLRGHILKIGGLKEKALAAYRHGIRHVLLPEEHTPEISDLPEEVRKRLTFHPVADFMQVLEFLLDAPPCRQPQRKRPRPSAPQPRA